MKVFKIVVKNGKIIKEGFESNPLFTEDSINKIKKELAIYLDDGEYKIGVNNNKLVKITPCMEYTCYIVQFSNGQYLKYYSDFGIVRTDDIDEAEEFGNINEIKEWADLYDINEKALKSILVLKSNKCNIGEYYLITHTLQKTLFISDCSVHGALTVTDRIDSAIKFYSVEIVRRFIKNNSIDENEVEIIMRATK